jgi:hypothetical protein
MSVPPLLRPPSDAVLASAVRHLDLVPHALGFAERAGAVGVNVTTHVFEIAGATEEHAAPLITENKGRLPTALLAGASAFLVC